MVSKISALGNTMTFLTGLVGLLCKCIVHGFRCTKLEVYARIKEICEKTAHGTEVSLGQTINK